MRRPAILLAFLFAVVFILITCSTKKPTSDNDYVGGIAVISGILIDGTGAGPTPNAVILIKDGHIQAVGTESSLEIPTGAGIIDVNGAYILPGLMNTHVHRAYDEDNLKEWAKSGVTTVRDLGNSTTFPELAFSIRDSLLKDDENSRLVAAGPVVTTVGGYGNYPVTSPDDAEAKVNGLIDAGADLIKIAIEDDLQGRTWPMLSMDEIKRITQTAHDRNKRVAAHISRSKHLSMAIQAGVDDVVHMVIDYLPDSLIAFMIEKDMYWVPTLELWWGVSELHNLNWDVIAKDNLRRFAQGGGKVALGTDYAGYVTPFDLGMPMREIQLMQAAGMTPMQILIAGSKHAAHVCNLENELGSIEPGKVADMIVVSGNPLDDLNSLSEVQIVIHNGVVIRDSTEEQ